MIVVIGVGQLGSELMAACTRLGMAFVGFGHEHIQVENPTSVFDALSQYCPGHPPSAVINTAAYHNLEHCERDSDRALMVNAIGSYNVARWCLHEGVKYVYVSTDYCAGTPTDDSGQPLSVYAKSKLAGELAALSMCPDSLVVRVGTLYGINGCRAKTGGGNLIDTIVGKIKKQEPFTLPDYTSVLTTYAHDAAMRILTNLNRCGVWYGTDQAQGVSHYRLGCRIADYLGLPNKIQAVSYDPTDTIRPSKTAVPKIGDSGHRRLGLASQNFDHGFVDPVGRYLVEKGHIDDRVSDSNTVTSAC